jgi:hypothetical protein
LPTDQQPPPLPQSTTTGAPQKHQITQHTASYWEARDSVSQTLGVLKAGNPLPTQYCKTTKRAHTWREQKEVTCEGNRSKSWNALRSLTQRERKKERKTQITHKRLKSKQSQLNQKEKRTDVIDKKKNSKNQVHKNTRSTRA